MAKKNLGVQVPEEVEHEIKEAALREFTTMSAVVRRWLNKGAESEGVKLNVPR